MLCSIWPPIETDIHEDVTSINGSCDDSESSFSKEPAAKKIGKRKRKDKISGRNTIEALVKKRSKIGAKKVVLKDSGNNVGGTKTFTVEGVLCAFPEKTEYGISFRATSMSEDEKKLEVVRLNKGAASGMKGAIKKMRIDVQYKDLVSVKMREFIVSSRTEQSREAYFRVCKSNSFQSESGWKFKGILLLDGILRGGLVSSRKSLMVLQM
jgi:hypothetical protein